MKRNVKSTKSVPHHSSLMAAALQDHIAREFGLINSTTQSSGSSASINSTRTVQLTLAQKLGLVSSPPPPLTRCQWDKAAELSSRRGDSIHPCPICQDVFGLQPQVLLSCTHTFHKSCLVAFERYSGKKRCPICRSPTYQTKPIHTGATHYRHTAATKIQALWRGYKVRKVFKEYRRTHPPTHPSLRVKYFSEKLTSLTSELVDQVAMTTESADNLLISVDSDLKESRRALKSMETHHSFLEPDWNIVFEKASQYITSHCPICLSPLSLPKPLTILSCSHLYHTTCLRSLESFTSDTSLHSCPICRLPYTSKDYNEHDI